MSHFIGVDKDGDGDYFSLLFPNYIVINLPVNVNNLKQLVFFLLI